MTGWKFARDALAATRRFGSLVTYVVYQSSGTAPRTPRDPNVKFVGVNFLASERDNLLPPLPHHCESFLLAGDGGVVAIYDGDVVGWAWVRPGPYMEETPSGHLSISGGLNIIRYFEVTERLRGRGLGQSILAELTHRLHTREVRATALVGTTNVSSRTCFERVGYVESASVSVYRIGRWTMTRWRGAT